MAAKFCTSWQANSFPNMVAGGYFDAYVTVFTANITILPTGGPFGGACAHLSDDAGQVAYAQKNLGANLATIFYGFWVQLTALASPLYPLGFFDGATPQVYLKIDTSGQIGIYRGVPGSGTLLATNVLATLPLSRYTFVEVGIHFNGSTGSVQLKFNGSDVISLTGSLNTAPSGNNSASVFQLGQLANAGGVGTPVVANLADLYLCDATGALNNTFLGVGQAVPFFAAANSVVQFTGTPNTGSNTFLNVNQNPSNPANYNFSSTATQKDLFTHAAMSASVTSILFMQLSAYWGLDAAGSRTAQLVFKAGGTEADLPASPLAVSPGLSWGQAIEEVDPSTSAPISVSNFNSSTFGYLLST